MRYAILGDVHANLEALEAALGFLADQAIDRYLQVGDIVGYGADPSACIRILRELGTVAVAGNHDWAVVGKLDVSCFNQFAREAVEWTRSVLTREELRYLEELRLVEVFEEEITLVHATPDQPELFDYILTPFDAQRAFEAFGTRVCFVGHSHVPAIFVQDGAIRMVGEGDVVLQDRRRALVNVGSIGQPRDDNPMLAVGIYDTATKAFQLPRIPYDVSRAAAKIAEVGLPGLLGERLYLGR